MQSRLVLARMVSGLAAFLLVILGGYGLSAADSGNLVTNGDFSSGYDVGYTTTYQRNGTPRLGPEGYYAITNVVGENKVSSFGEKMRDDSVFVNPYGSDATNTNLFFAANGSNTAGGYLVWKTSSVITVQKGDTYRFEAYLATLGSIATYGGPPQLQFQLGDGTTWRDLGTTVTMNDDTITGHWYQTYADGTFSESGNYYVRLVNTQTATVGNDFAIDNIYFGLKSSAPVCDSSIATCDSSEHNVGAFDTGSMTNNVQSVTTTSVNYAGRYSVSVKGSVTFGSDIDVKTVGACWSRTTQEPDLSNNDGCTSEAYNNTASILDSLVASSGTLSTSSTYVFNSTITGLSGGSTYYVRAYATNSVGTTYGSAVSVQTTSGGSLVGVSLPRWGLLFMALLLLLIGGLLLQSRFN